jgi:predicted nuclease of predicted toxin-antitoxin system
MTEATDIEISAKAVELGATIITKDNDFVRLAAIGPKVIWVRLGNCPNDLLYGSIRRSLHLILDELATAQVAALAEAP